MTSVFRRVSLVTAATAALALVVATESIVRAQPAPVKPAPVKPAPALALLPPGPPPALAPLPAPPTTNAAPVLPASLDTGANGAPIVTPQPTAADVPPTPSPATAAPASTAPPGLPTSFHGIPIVYTPAPPAAAPATLPLPEAKSKREWMIALNLLAFVDGVALRPFFEIPVEYKLSDKFGVGGIVGLGASREGWLRYELGPKFTAYPIGTFHNGLQLAADLTLLGESGTLQGTTSKIGRRSLTLAGTVGYKYEAKSGITVGVDLGIRVRTSRAVVSDGAASTSGALTYIDPVFRGYLGYSF